MDSTIGDALDLVLEPAIYPGWRIFIRLPFLAQDTLSLNGFVAASHLPCPEVRFCSPASSWRLCYPVAAWALPLPPPSIRCLPLRGTVPVELWGSGSGPPRSFFCLPNPEADLFRPDWGARWVRGGVGWGSSAKRPSPRRQSKKLPGRSLSTRLK